MTTRWHDLADMRWAAVEDADTGKFRSEAMFRDYLAVRAVATGWQATTEYQLGAWGRVDLLALADHDAYVVECKLELRTAGQIRDAVQQVVSYSAQLHGFRGRTVHPVIVAPVIDRAMCDSMLERTGVMSCTADELIDRFEADGSLGWAHVRLTEMIHRMAAMRLWVARQSKRQNVMRLHEALAVFSARGSLTAIDGVLVNVGDESVQLRAVGPADLRSYAVDARRLSPESKFHDVVASLAEEMADAVEAAGVSLVGDLAALIEAQP